MSDYDLPELPSDEELGIDGVEPDEKSGEGAGVGPGEPTGPGEPEAPKEPKGPGPGASGPRGGWRGPVTLLFLAVVSWLATSEWALPDTVPLDAPDTVFSSGRAMVDLAAIARQPHPPGSPEHARVREYLLERLSDLGLEPTVQTTVSRRGDRLATVRNVVARLEGTESTGAIVLTAHYDARTQAVGAGDDGTGVVTILETLRALQAGEPPRNDVIVLLTDAEELGLLGARAFVGEHPWMDDVALVLSVEMRGGGGVSIMFETAPENGWIIDALAEGDPRPFANSMSAEVYRRLPNDTDFTPFRERGVQGLNFAGIGNAHVYHQAYDSPENLDERTVQHHGLHVLGMVRELGGRDLSSVKAPDLVYFNLPFLGLVTYPPAWVIPLTAWIVLVLILAGVWGRRLGLRPTGLLAGLGVGVVAVGASAGAGAVLFGQVRGYHPEYGALHGSAFHSEGWYVLALVAVAVAVTAGLLALARRRFSLGELALGAQAVPLVGVLGLTFMAPMAAMNLQWPALAAALAAGVVATVPTARGPGKVAWPILLALAVPVLVLMVRLVELLWLSMSLSLAATLAGIVALTLLLLLPLLDTLLEPNGWWAPLLSVVLAAGFTGLGLRTTRPSVERPAPSTLLYSLDHDQGTALWATRAGYRFESQPRPGLAWARLRTGSDLADEPEAGVPLPAGRSYRVAEAPVAAVPTPALTVRSDSVIDRARRLGLALVSRVGAETMEVQLAPGDGLLRSVGGRSLSGETSGNDERGLRSFEHFGTPNGAPDGTLVIDLEVAEGADTVELTVVETHLRPGELVGEGYFRRPPGLAPNVVMRSDRAVLRTTFRLVPGPESVEVLRAQPTEPVPDAAGAEAPPSDTVEAAGADTTEAAGADTVEAAGADTTEADTTGGPVPDTAAPDTTSAGYAPSAS